MKKLFSLILCIFLLFGLMACGGQKAVSTTTTAATPSLQVGYSKVSIVPEKPLALSSTNQATYDAVYEDVYTTCVAITDVDGETLLLFTTDISYCNGSNQTMLRKEIAEVSNVPVDNIVFSCTHNHSGLDPTGQALTLIKKAVAQAAAEAMADRTAATLSIATGEAPGMNFVRHYTTVDGHWVGDNYYSPTGSKAKTSERDADASFRLMRFERGEKKPVLLMNWQAHGTYSYKMESLCADFIGSLRTTMEEKSGCLFAYFQGAAGNLNPVSSIGLNKYEKTLSGMTMYGTALADMVLPSLQSMTPVNADNMDILQATHTLKVRVDDTDTVMAAAEYRFVRESGGSHAEAVVAAGELIHGDQGAEYVQHRSRNAGTQDITLSAIRLGDVSFLVVPYEMFDDTGVYIRENSPFDMTFILGYANGRNGYIPSAPCIEHGCYEYEGSLFEAGSAEALVESYLTLLKQLAQ